MTSDVCADPDGIPPATAPTPRDVDSLRLALFECSALPLVIIDPNTRRIVDCNPAAAAIHGFADVHGALGVDLLDVSAPRQYDGSASADRSAQYIQRALAEGALVFEWLCQRPNGQRWDAEVHLARFQVSNVMYLQCTSIDITERRRDRQALRASEARYRYITDNTKDVLWILDAETLRFLYVSPSVTKLRGYTPEEVLSAPMDAALTPMAVVEIRELVARRSQSLAEGHAVDGEQLFYTEDVPQPCKNGTIVWTEVITTYVRNPVNGRIEIHGVTRDISERRKQQLALLRERAFSDSLIDSLPGIFYLYDADLRLRRWNRNHETALGYTAEELRDKRLADWYAHDEVRTRVERAVLGVLQTGESCSIEAPLLHKDAAEAPYLLTAARVETEDGPMVMGVGLDVSSLKRAEAALRLSEARLRASLENTPHVAVQWYDAEGRILYWNPASESMYGWRADEVIGKTLDCCLYDPRDAAAFLEVLKGISATGTAFGPFETRIRRRDGSTGWVLATTFAMPADDDKRGFVCMDVDITERKRAEIDRERLQVQLVQSQKMEAVGRLAGGVAHDFNNVLCAILGQAELLIDEYPDNESLQSALQVIRDAALRSANLTRQLLAFASRQTIVPQVLNLNEAVHSILKMLERLIGESIELNWRPGRGLWPVKLDPSQLDQLLTNLCVNARDAIDSVGRIEIETSNVTLTKSDHSRHPTGEYVVLSVMDNGRGMTSDVLEHVFEPFYTTKVTGKGTGLGLATVYGIVRQNDGFIELQSEPGRGSSFRIYFPRQFASIGLEPGIDTSTVTKDCTETVLVVEDEAGPRTIAASMLRKLGYTVLCAALPSVALEIVRQHQGAIQLLLTDVVMPGMNGRDLWQNVRVLQPEIRCLFMSGYSADVLGREGVLSSEIHFIQKPFTLDALARKTREALR